MKPIKILGIIAGSLLVALIAFTIFSLRQAHYYQEVVGSGLDRKMGFKHGSPYIKSGEEEIEVFTLHPSPDGILEKSGVRDGDIVIDHTITGFYRALYTNRGATITFRVVDGGDGIPIAQRSSRTITLAIP